MLEQDLDLRTCISEHFAFRKLKLKRHFEINPNDRVFKEGIFMNEIDKILNDNLEYFDRNEDEIISKLEEIKKHIQILPLDTQLDLINSKLIQYDYFLLLSEFGNKSLLVKTTWYNQKNTLELIE